MKPQGNYTRNEVEEMLREAQSKMREALELLEDYARETGDEHAKAYIIPNLAVLVEREHGYLDRSENIDDLLERLPGLYGPEANDIESYILGEYEKNDLAEYKNAFGSVDLEKLVEGIAEQFDLPYDEEEEEYYIGDEHVGYLTEGILQADGIDYI